MPVEKVTPIKKKKPAQKKKVSTRFTGVLAVISIIGFTEILLRSFFNVNIADYSTFLFLMTMGVGLILVSHPKELYKRSRKTINETNFSMMITFVLGSMTIIAAILSFPLINLDHPILSATMGIVSIISIIFIVFQTWVMKE